MPSNYVSKRTTYRSVIGALLDNDGDIVTDDKAKAELFNEYFASVGTVDNGVLPVCTDFINCTNSLDTVKFSTLDVAIVMSKLKTSLSSGPDGLPPILFKKLAARLAGRGVIHCLHPADVSRSRTTKMEGSHHYPSL